MVVEFSGVAYWYTHVGANSSFATQYEQLLRKLLRRPQSPALLLLHHYAWYYAKTDGLSAGAYYHTTELQFSTLGQVGCQLARYPLPCHATYNTCLSHALPVSAPAYLL